MDTVTSADGTRIAYDRYGDGDSGDAGPVSVQHEVEDIAALIEAFGAPAAVCDWSSALGDHNMHGAPLRAEEWATVTCPALVAYGAKTAAVLKHASRSLADVLPNATLRELPGQNHNVSPSAIAPLISEFVAGTPAPAG